MTEAVNEIIGESICIFEFVLTNLVRLNLYERIQHINRHIV